MSSRHDQLTQLDQAREVAVQNLHRAPLNPPLPNSNSTTTINPTQLISAQFPFTSGERAGGASTGCVMYMPPGIQAYQPRPSISSSPSPFVASLFHLCSLCLPYPTSKPPDGPLLPARTVTGPLCRDQKPPTGYRSAQRAWEDLDVYLFHHTRPGLPVLLCTSPLRLIIRYTRPEHGDPVEMVT